MEKRTSVDWPARYWVIAALVALALVTGCESHAEDEAISVDPASLPELRLASTPAAIIGNVDQAGHHLVNVVGAHRMSDGRIIVADAGRTELLEYDHDGTFLRVMARGGEGPGELASLAATAIGTGDTLVVWDRHRVTKFSPEGAYVSAVDRGVLPPARVSGAEAPGSWQGLRPLLDGSLIATQTVFPSFVLGRGPDGVRRDTLSLPILGPDGELAGEIEDLPGAETIVTAGSSWSPFPLGRRLLAAVGPGRVYIGSGVDPEILVFSYRGEPVDRIDLAFPRRPLPDDLWRSVESRLTGFEGLARPESVPAYSDLAVDRVDRIWVQEYRIDPGEPMRWIILTPEGEPLARVTSAQTSGRLLEAGPDYVIFLERDELDMPRVVVLNLHRAFGNDTNPTTRGLHDPSLDS